MCADTTVRCYTLCEIAQNDGHCGRALWFIYKDGVYDVTKFAKSHPGGVHLIREYAGKDATEAFNYVGHSSDAIKLLRDMKIGTVSPHCLAAVKTQSENRKKLKKRYKLLHLFC